MNTLDIFLSVATIALAVLVGALTPTLLQLRRTIKKSEDFMDNLNQELTPLLKSLSQTAMELQILSTSLNNKIKRADRVLDTLQQTSNTVLLATDLVKNSVLPVLSQVSGVSSGIKAFIAFVKTLKKHH